jgi:hypothetical protein
LLRLGSEDAIEQTHGDILVEVDGDGPACTGPVPDDCLPA